jgi:hypothetical protein
LLGGLAAYWLLMRGEPSTLGEAEPEAASLLATEA